MEASMKKRRPSFDISQMGFTFDPPEPARGEAALAGLERQVSAAVGLILKEDTRSRAEIAGAMSALLAERVSPGMLDGYRSEEHTSELQSLMRISYAVFCLKKKKKKKQR